MGSIAEAVCICGFSRKCTFGGTMSSFMEDGRFPYWCHRCGLVSANVQNLPIICPECEASDIIQYGTNDDEQQPGYSVLILIRFLLTRTWPKGVVSIPKGTAAISDWPRRVPMEFNLCPSCRKMTLKFLPCDVFFD